MKALQVLSRFLRINTIRKKLLVYFFLTTLTVGLTSVYTYYNTQNLKDTVSQQYQNNLYFKTLLQHIENIRKSLSDYLETKSSDDLKDFLTHEESLRDFLPEQQTLTNVHAELMFRGVVSMVHAYIQQADQAVQAKRGRNINEYIRRFEESEKIISYLNFYIDQINIHVLDSQSREFLNFSEKFRVLQVLNLFMIIDAILLSFLIILWFTRVLTDPIVHLSQLAERIAGGDFEVEEMRVPGKDEVATMATAFNRMKNSIKDYIFQLHEKAEVEKNLMEQRLKNMQMKNLLKIAELKTLQSQINPHFIFNTLNTGIQLAIMEEAERTAAYMDNLANLFRMNMRKFESSGTLGDEVKAVEYYAYILKIRFADRFRIRISIPEEFWGLSFPVMIFQPLVENAVNHGLMGKEEGGEVAIFADHLEDQLVLEIKDNGVGMDKAIIHKVLAVDEESDMEEAALAPLMESQHIGLINVVQRLRLFFNSYDVISLESSQEWGSSVRIIIPLEGQGV